MESDKIKEHVRRILSLGITNKLQVMGELEKIGLSTRDARRTIKRMLDQELHEESGKLILRKDTMLKRTLKDSLNIPQIMTPTEILRESAGVTLSENAPEHIVNNLEAHKPYIKRPHLRTLNYIIANNGTKTLSQIGAELKIYDRVHLHYNSLIAARLVKPLKNIANGKVELAEDTLDPLQETLSEYERQLISKASPHLTAMHKHVLRFLISNPGLNTFQTISNGTGLNVESVKRVCIRLYKNRGLEGMVEKITGKVPADAMKTKPLTKFRYLKRFAPRK